MKKKLLTGFLLALTSGGLIAHWYFGDRGRFTTDAEFTDLRRSVEGQDLVSLQDPAATLRFHPAYRYLGGQKFILYGLADTEQHFFVETTADDRLESLYWVQYESYLPGKSYTYDYSDSPLRLELGEYTFFTDTAVVASDANRRRKRGTDGALAREFLARHGYALPNEYVYARLVYLTDDSKQKELLIIFIEDLAPSGLTAADLREGGSRADRWPEVEHGHLDEIQRTLSVRPHAAGARQPVSP